MDEHYTTPEDRAIETPVILSQKELFAHFLEAPIHFYADSTLVGYIDECDTPRSLAAEGRNFCSADAWPYFDEYDGGLIESLMDAIADRREPAEELRSIILDIGNLLRFFQQISTAFYRLCEATVEVVDEDDLSGDESEGMATELCYVLPARTREVAAA